MADNEVGTFLPTHMEFDKQKQKRQGFICQVQMVKRWFRPARSEPNIHQYMLVVGHRFVYYNSLFMLFI